MEWMLIMEPSWIWMANLIMLTRISMRKHAAFRTWGIERLRLCGFGQALMRMRSRGDVYVEHCAREYESFVTCPA